MPTADEILKDLTLIADEEKRRARVARSDRGLRSRRSRWAGVLVSER